MQIIRKDITLGKNDIAILFENSSENNHNLPKKENDENVSGNAYLFASSSESSVEIVCTNNVLCPLEII